MKPINYENLNKLYYSIGEVADMFEVNASLIRFWEKEFVLLKPKKNQKGNRQFTPKDIANIHKIYVLVKEKGFTLDGAKKAMKAKEAIQSDSQLTADEKASDLVLEKLHEIRTKLIRLKQ
jgi:DNA-binding transcriptional MerR regulator